MGKIEAIWDTLSNMTQIESTPIAGKRREKHALLFAKSASLSLFHKNIPVDRYKEIYITLAKTKQVEPLNREEELLPQFLKILNERQLKVTNTLNSYWNPNQQYNP